ncbi:MAG: T9SS type A sorting domain-containing protein [Bacteroidales bacterium]|nr:T9SS type A sorting domain-containing protein [Bacteroidales bacterium]
MTFTITPNFGARVAAVVVDGIDIGSVASYTFTNVSRDHTIFASFSGMGVYEFGLPEVKLYPNPAKDVVHIEGEDIKTVILYDLLGNRLHSIEMTTCNEMSLEGLSKGVYVLILVTKNGSVGYRKLLVTNWGCGIPQPLFICNIMKDKNGYDSAKWCLGMQ